MLRAQEDNSYKTSALKNLTCHMEFCSRLVDDSVCVFYYIKAPFVVIIQGEIFSNKLRYFYERT